MTPSELTPRLEDPLDQSKIRHVQVDGVRTRFYEEGAGEALVLLHGGDIGSIDSLDSWSLNLKGLAEHFHVYALDKLGAGHTGTPRSDQGFTYEAIVRHTAKWLDVVGVREAHLVGHSRGGLLAASLALSIPNLARTTVIINSASLAPDHPDPRLRSGTFYAEIERRTPLGLPTSESVRIEPEANSYSTEHVTDEFIQRRLEVGLLPSQRDAVTRMRGGLHQEFYMPSMAKARMETLRAIDERGLPSRTLMVWSLNDRSAPLADVGIKLYEQICAKTRHAEMHVFNAAAHYTYREHSGAFNRLIQSFCLGEGVGSRVAMSAKA